MPDVFVENGTLLLVFAFALTVLVATLTPVVFLIHQWRQVRQAEIDASLQRAEMEAGLKREMVNRGMSAADIRQVMESRVDPADAAKEAGCAKAWPGHWAKWAVFGRMWAEAAKSRERRCG
jgi:hypothetical protein